MKYTGMALTYTNLATFHIDRNICGGGDSGGGDSDGGYSGGGDSCGGDSGGGDSGSGGWRNVHFVHGDDGDGGRVVEVLLVDLSAVIEGVVDGGGGGGVSGYVSN